MLFLRKNFRCRWEVGFALNLHVGRFVSPHVQTRGGPSVLNPPQHLLSSISPERKKEGIISLADVTEGSYIVRKGV